MFKTIIKETAIVILMIAAIALLLGILFYDYVPTSKVVPIKVEAYTLPEDVQEEIGRQETLEEDTIIKTYIIDSDELQTYEYTKEYDKGKANPFAVSNTGNGTNTNSNTTGNGTNTSSTNTSNSDVSINVENTNINSLK